MGGIPVAGGKKIKYGRLIRSGRLHKLPEETVSALTDMGVDTIVDMRCDTEINEHPPTILPGAQYYYLPLVCTATPGITAGKSMAHTMFKESKRIKEEFGSADNYIIRTYEYILDEPHSREKLAAIFNLLAEEKQCLIFHCNSGKDRTGLVAALIEGVLGADRETIIEDYMASNIFLYRRRKWQRRGLRIMIGFNRFRELLHAMMVSKPVFISSVIDYMDKKYGGITGYVQEALGISGETIQKIRDNFLE